MKSGNAAILKHKADGRALRVFRGARGTVTYEGEFELDDAEPFQRTDAPETGDGPLREVFVFRLRPKDVEPPEPTSKLTEVLAGPTRVDVPIEQQETEKAYVNPSREPYEAERREQKLVLALEAHLLALGHKVTRQRLLPSGEARPIITDLFDATTGTLVEAKGSVERNAIRMAIGQALRLPALLRRWRAKSRRRPLPDGAPCRPLRPAQRTGNRRDPSRRKGLRRLNGRRAGQRGLVDHPAISLSWA